MTLRRPHSTAPRPTRSSFLPRWPRPVAVGRLVWFPPPRWRHCRFVHRTSHVHPCPGAAATYPPPAFSLFPRWFRPIRFRQPVALRCRLLVLFPPRFEAGCLCRPPPQPAAIAALVRAARQYWACADRSLLSPAAGLSRSFSLPSRLHIRVSLFFHLLRRRAARRGRRQPLSFRFALRQGRTPSARTFSHHRRRPRACSLHSFGASGGLSPAAPAQVSHSLRFPSRALGRFLSLRRSLSSCNVTYN